MLDTFVVSFAASLAACYLWHKRDGVRRFAGNMLIGAGAAILLGGAWIQEAGVNLLSGGLVIVS